MKITCGPILFASYPIDISRDTLTYACMERFLKVKRPAVDSSSVN